MDQNTIKPKFNDQMRNFDQTLIKLLLRSEQRGQNVDQEAKGNIILPPSFPLYCSLLGSLIMFMSNLVFFFSFIFRKRRY